VIRCARYTQTRNLVDEVLNTLMIAGFAGAVKNQDSQLTPTVPYMQTSASTAMLMAWQHRQPCAAPALFFFSVATP
jgi:hypothetical protein